MYNLFVSKKKIIILLVIFILIVYIGSFIFYGFSPFGIENEKTLLRSFALKVSSEGVEIQKNAIPFLFLIFLVSGFFIGKNEFNQMLAFILFIGAVYYISSKIFVYVKIYDSLSIKNIINPYLVSEVTIVSALPKKVLLLKLIVLIVILYSFFLESILSNLYIVGVFVSIVVGIFMGNVLKRILNVIL